MSDAFKRIVPDEKDTLIHEISLIIMERTGVQLGVKQVAMVESRLRRRLSELGLSHFHEYKSYLDRNRSQEIEALVSILTTHHTFFFREFVQFEFLEQQLPKMVERARARGSKVIEIYSAACSRGQEVYSLAMHLHRHLKILAPGMDFSVFGSDVDSASVKVAANGVYRIEELKAVPISYMGNHWAKGTADIADFVKARKSLLEKCSFGVINLMNLKELGSRKFDAIFCRNVFIYFTPEQVKKITDELSQHLYSEGLLFVGVSESLHSHGVTLQSVGPSVYAQSAAGKAAPKALAVPILEAPAQVAEVLPNPLRVLCVDDSASILALLKRILCKDQGFEVVGVAANGQEASEAVAKLKPHAITLDIHMPVKTGIEFLEGARGKDIPPVVMVTSVAREDAALAWKALSLGASDYVEKPALNNLEERADEIRMKLKSAYRARNGKIARSLDRQISRSIAIKSPEQATCLCVFGLGDLEKCLVTVKELILSGVSLIMAVEGADSILPSLAERIQKEVGRAVAVNGLKEAVRTVASRKGPVSVIVWGEVSRHGAQEILMLTGAQLLLEDLGAGKGSAHLAEIASDILPATSFSYLAIQFLAEKQEKAR